MATHDGSTGDSTVFGGVSGLGANIAQVSAGYSFGLALTTGGTVWAWGDNQHGQLGDGT